MKNNRETQIRWVWSAMKQRCKNPNNKGYPNYGGRGINYCEEWEVFENFLNDMGIPPVGWTLDRVNNDLGYCVKNCVWSLPTGQNRNKRNNKFYEVEGRILTLKQYANHKNLNYFSLKTREQKGLSVEEILFEGKFPNNNIYGKDSNGRFIKKTFTEDCALLRKGIRENEHHI